MPALHQQGVDPAIKFREALGDALTVIGTLGPYCATPTEMADMIELGLTSEGQFRLLMEKISEGKR